MESRDSKSLDVQLAAKKKWLADRERLYEKASERVSDVEKRFEALRKELAEAQKAAAAREAEIATAQGELDAVERHIALGRCDSNSTSDVTAAAAETISGGGSNTDGLEASQSGRYTPQQVRDERASLGRHWRAKEQAME